MALAFEKERVCFGGGEVSSAVRGGDIRVCAQLGCIRRGDGKAHVFQGQRGSVDAGDEEQPGEVEAGARNHGRYASWTDVSIEHNCIHPWDRGKAGTR